MLHSRSLRIAALSAIVLSACNDADTVAPSNEPDVELASLLSAESNASARSETDRASSGSTLFDRLAEAIPGFGGLYRTAPCVVAVVLTDLSNAREAVRLVRAAIEPRVKRSCPNGIRVEPVQGQFTYRELQAYLDAARPLLQLRGVTGVTVNYKLNRLVIFVAARSVVPSVLEALPRVGIPADAVTFQLSTRTRSTTGTRG